MKLIKTIQSFVLLLMLAAGVAGCQKHNNITSDAWNGEICLSSEISSQVKTRVTNNDVPDKQIAANKIVSFFVDDAGVADVAKKTLYENYLVQANGTGGFTKYGLPQAADMYYPATGNKVDIYAFLTNGFVSNQTFPALAITHSVMKDQSTQHGANYLNSDLLYAANKAVARSSQPVQMNFYHLLSKVEVALKAGAGTPNLANAVVTIENTRLKANFLPDKSVDINDQSTGQSARAAMITPTANNSNSNPITPIKIGTSIETSNFGTTTTYSSAVVVPQKVAKGSSFIKVTPMNGSPLYYTLPADLELKSGYKYQFQITVNLTGLTVTSTIADWATGTQSSDIAVIPPPPPIGSKGPEGAAVGDFYFSDGTLETGSITILTTAQQAACVGVVYYVGNITNEDALLKKDHSTCTHGLVVALHDAAAQILWSTSYEQVNAWTNATERGDKKLNIIVVDKMQGYSNTVALTAYNNESSNVQNNDNLKV
ncbi:MAG: fimbrillin family protein, partial [Acidaminococcaceae bacterium]